jgi:hypothetical protein
MPKDEPEEVIALVVPASRCNFCQQQIIPNEIVFMTKPGMESVVKVCPNCISKAKGLRFIEAEGQQ